MLRKQAKRSEAQRLNIALSQANGRPPPAVVSSALYILDILVLTDTKPRRATAARPPRPLMDCRDRGQRYQAFGLEAGQGRSEKKVFFF